jgi:hypothetical protein
MYSTRSGLVLGFHGCDKSLIEKIILQQSELKQSSNKYDWLGHGSYFWKYSPERAFEFATFLKDNPDKTNNPIKEPAVLGAVIDLGYCFDLLDYGALQWNLL